VKLKLITTELLTFVCGYTLHTDERLKILPQNVSRQSESLFGESNKDITFHKSKSENCGSSLNKNEVDHPVDV